MQKEWHTATKPKKYFKNVIMGHPYRKAGDSGLILISGVGLYPPDGLGLSPPYAIPGCVVSEVVSACAALVKGSTGFESCPVPHP